MSRITLVVTPVLEDDAEALYLTETGAEVGKVVAALDVEIEYPASWTK